MSQRAEAHAGLSRRLVTCVVVRIFAAPNWPWSGTLTWPPGGWSPTPLNEIGQGSDAWSVPPSAGSPHRPLAWSPEFGWPSQTANGWFGTLSEYVGDAPGASDDGPLRPSGRQLNWPQPTPPHSEPSE